MNYTTANEIADTLHQAGIEALVIPSREGYSVAAESPHHIWWALGRLGKGCGGTLEGQFGIWPWTEEDDDGNQEQTEAAVLTWV